MVFRPKSILKNRVVANRLQRNARAKAVLSAKGQKRLLNLHKVKRSTDMSCIPPSAFSAGSIRETQRNMKVSHITKAKESSSKYFNTSSQELTPLKYNSKLMMSIWGYYNRYSPHNVKKVNDAPAFPGEMQQSAAISPKEPVMKFKSLLDHVWAAINVSQSH